MNKEEYIKRIEEINKEIEQSRLKIKEAEQQYIRDNAPCQVGDVLLMNGDPVIVRSLGISISRNVVIHKISKQRIDGVFSKAESYPWGDLTDNNGVKMPVW